MKKSIITSALLAAMFVLQMEGYGQAKELNSKNPEKEQASEKAAVETLIHSYQDALNASDVNKVASMYTPNGVLLANAAPTAEGVEQVKGTYQYVFDHFTYTLAFTILELQVNGNTAFARSTSKGSFVIKSSNQTVPDENRELFVFEKKEGQWKIAKYMYNKSK